jgi:hypothetical protein
MLLRLENFFAVWRSLIEFVATAIETNLVGHGHEDRILLQDHPRPLLAFPLRSCGVGTAGGQDVYISLGG